MRMRRARYLAGDDASLEADNARDCMCGPAIPTRKCAPARPAGSSTNDCRDHRDHPTPTRRRLSPSSVKWCSSGAAWKGLGRWHERRPREARLRRQDKSREVRHGRLGVLVLICKASSRGALGERSLRKATSLSNGSGFRTSRRRSTALAVRLDECESPVHEPLGGGAGVSDA